MRRIWTIAVFVVCVVGCRENNGAPGVLTPAAPDSRLTASYEGHTGGVNLYAVRDSKSGDEFLLAESNYNVALSKITKEPR